MNPLSEYTVLTDAWKSDDNVEIFIAEIDLDNEENKYEKVGECRDEHVKLELIPIDTMFETLKSWVEAKKCALEGAVWMFALGMQFNKMIKGIIPSK